jgi:hypothetical protein
VSDAVVNGKPAESTWAGYVDLYERLNGRTPTPAQVRAASAKRDAATACGEPFAAVIALDQEAEAGRERLASAIEEAVKRLCAEPRTAAGPVTLAPESLAAIERIEPMASDVRRLLAVMLHGASVNRWSMFGAFVVGLVLMLVGAGTVEWMGARPHGVQLLLTTAALLKLCGLATALAGAGGIATWWMTRR